MTNNQWHPPDHCSLDQWAREQSSYTELLKSEKDPHLHCTQKGTTTGLLSGKSAHEQPHLTSSQISGFIKAINAIWGKSAVVPQDKHILYQPLGEKQESVRTEHLLPPPMQISTSIQ